MQCVQCAHVCIKCRVVRSAVKFTEVQNRKPSQWSSTPQWCVWVICQQLPPDLIHNHSPKHPHTALKPRVNHFQKHPQPTLKLYRISSQKLTSARKRLAQFKLLQGLLFDKAGSEKVTFGPFTFTWHSYSFWFALFFALLLPYLHVSHVNSNALLLPSFCIKVINAKWGQEEGIWIDMRNMQIL